jgi:hypothetical protein
VVVVKFTARRRAEILAPEAEQLADRLEAHGGPATAVASRIRAQLGQGGVGVHMDESDASGNKQASAVHAVLTAWLDEDGPEMSGEVRERLNRLRWAVSPD